jgi:hypothetical protein
VAIPDFPFFDTCPMSDDLNLHFYISGNGSAGFGLLD